MSKHTEPVEQDADANDSQLKNRRDFLKSLGRWSTIIIGAVGLGGMVAPDDAAGWLNGGGGWVNARGGGGGGLFDMWSITKRQSAPCFSNAPETLST